MQFVASDFKIYGLTIWYAVVSCGVATVRIGRVHDIQP